MIRNKKGAGMPGWVWIFIIGGVLIYTGVLSIGGLGGLRTGQSSVIISPQSPTHPTEIRLVDDGCPDTDRTSLVFNVFNDLNTSADNYDVTLRLYDADTQQFITSITDTTSPSGTNVACNRKIEGRILSVDGTQNDNSNIKSVSVDAGTVTVIDNPIHGSAIQFKSAGSDQAFSIRSERAGVLQFRAYDNNLRALMYDGGDASATDFELTAANFTSTTSNTSYTSIAAGDYLDVELEFQGSTGYTDYIDQGAYACVNRDTTKWDVPTMTLTQAGVTTVLQDHKALGKLTPGESQLFSDWEDCFFIPKGDYSSRSSGKLRLRVQATNDPVIEAADDDNINLRIYSRGTYGSRADSNVLKLGAANDATSAAAVYTLQRAFFSVS